MNTAECNIIHFGKYVLHGMLNTWTNRNIRHSFMGVGLDSSFHAKSRCRLEMSENTLLTRTLDLSRIKT
jgi:hypothetical protein